MSQISDRYRRLATGVTDKISQVPADKWGAQSPCPEWTALDVVRHLTETPGMFFGLIGETGPEVPPVEDDPLDCVGRRPRRGASSPRRSGDSNS